MQVVCAVVHQSLKEENYDQVLVLFSDLKRVLKGRVSTGLVDVLMSRTQDVKLAQQEQHSETNGKEHTKQKTIKHEIHQLRKNQEESDNAEHSTLMKNPGCK